MQKDKTFRVRTVQNSGTPAQLINAMSASDSGP